MKFSEKYGLVPSKSIQIESMDEVLRIRLINIILKHMQREHGSSEMEYILDKFGLSVNVGYSNTNAFKKLLYQSQNNWFLLYDIIDFTFCFENECIPVYAHGERKLDLCLSLNQILEEEKSGYRIVNEEVAPITNQTEISSIEQACATEFDSVNTHISKALLLYSDRHEPDYENSIKESISAVESICCIITNLSGAQATLGNALKKLDENGVKIHPAMKNAFSSLYGYASDEDGIRHGGIEFKNAPAEDAKFMLVSCSAFANYLIEKYSKIKGA